MKKSNKNVVTKKAETKIAEAGLGVLTKSEPSFLSAINEMTFAWKEYKQVQAVEETKRAQILKDRDIAVTSIKEQAQLIRFALEKQFGERADNFSELFKRLDEGFERGDDKMIDSVKQEEIMLLASESLNLDSRNIHIDYMDIETFTSLEKER